MFVIIKHIYFKIFTLVFVMGVLVLSPVSVVICYGSDGQVALKPVSHGHCCCTENTHHQDSQTDTGTVHRNSHKHCTDFALNSAWSVHTKDPYTDFQSNFISTYAGTSLFTDVLADIDSTVLFDYPPYFNSPCFSVILRL